MIVHCCGCVPVRVRSIGGVYRAPAIRMSDLGPISWGHGHDVVFLEKPLTPAPPIRFLFCDVYDYKAILPEIDVM
jgi:hypothetical protein